MLTFWRNRKLTNYEYVSKRWEEQTWSKCGLKSLVKTGSRRLTLISKSLHRETLGHRTARGRQTDHCHENQDICPISILRTHSCLVLFFTWRNSRNKWNERRNKFLKDQVVEDCVRLGNEIIRTLSERDSRLLTQHLWLFCSSFYCKWTKQFKWKLQYFCLFTKKFQWVYLYFKFCIFVFYKIILWAKVSFQYW